MNHLHDRADHEIARARPPLLDQFTRQGARGGLSWLDFAPWELEESSAVTRLSRALLHQNLIGIEPDQAGGDHQSWLI